MAHRLVLTGATVVDRSQDHDVVDRDGDPPPAVPALRRVDVHISEGVVIAVTEPGAEPDTGAAPGGDPTDPVTVEDLGGMLLLGAAADPHTHLDKALSADRVVNVAGDLAGAIDAWMRYRSDATVADMADRATRAVQMLVANGVTAVRTHVDLGEGIGIRAAEALTETRERVADLVTMQIVGLPTCPVTGDDGAVNRADLLTAVERGLIDLVGGAPAIDPDPHGAVDWLLDLAHGTGLDVDLHIDETLDFEMLSLEHLAQRVMERGFENRVTASHCVSLGMQSPWVQQRVARAVADAGIGVVALPQTNLFLQARGVTTAPPRGLTAIGMLRGAGVAVAAGADNIQDPFNPMGRADPFETASLLVSAAHRLPDVAWAMVSDDARSVMGLPPAGPVVGRRADLVAIGAESLREAVASGAATRRTWVEGRLVAERAVAGGIVERDFGGSDEAGS
jgi:cytosine deaminase